MYCWLKLHLLRKKKQVWIDAFFPKDILFVMTFSFCTCVPGSGLINSDQIENYIISLHAGSFDMF